MARKNKGQMFIIAAIIFVIGLVVIKNSLTLHQFLENKRFVESGLEKLEFQNIKKEIDKVIQISYDNKENLVENINNFILFARDVLSTHLSNLNGILIETIHDEVVANSDMQINITLLNLIGNIEILNITFNNSTRSFSDIQEGTIINTYFIFNTNSDNNYTLNFYYKTSTENAYESLVIPVEIGRSKFVGFFDIRLNSERAEYRDKFIRIVSW